MLKKRIPIVYMILAAVLGCVASVVAVEMLNRPSTDQAKVIANQPMGSADYNFERLDGYKYIRPIFIAEPKEESSYYQPLKANIEAYVNAAKTKGNIANASVYIKDFSNDEWVAYNTKDVYHPGSLFKVITMISFFRMAETDAGLLQKEVMFPANSVAAPAQTFASKKIQPGNKYTIKELIYYMIVHNDNDASMLLHQHIDNAVFTKAFQDLGLKKPAAVPDPAYTMSVKEYSRFVSVLYEGAYLTIPSSEAAISLLCEVAFAEGATKQLPAGLTVAHKFGEAKDGDLTELHESAVVYLNEQPYLITIMTKGHSPQQLAAVMSDLSKLVYDEMAKRAL